MTSTRPDAANARRPPSIGGKESNVRKRRFARMSLASTVSTMPASSTPAKPAHGPLAAHACPWPIILGIDPGTRVVGYGAIVAAESGPRLLAAGALRADIAQSVPERLGWIKSELERLLLQVRPTIVVVEQAFAARNVQSALRIGEGRGVVLACAAAFGAEVVQYAPAVAKKALIGHGAADKTQIAKMVGHLLGLKDPPKPLDATDALALALAHMQRRPRFQAARRL